MTRREVLDSIELKKRFCKDCNLPISMYENPYFYQRVCAIDKLYGSMAAFDRFCDELKEYRNAQEFLEHYNLVKDAMITYIKNTEGYRSFNECMFAAQSNYPKRNVYVEENNDCMFVYIDMKKANYSSMRHFDASIFGDVCTWEEFVERFTKCEHIKSSKYIRQVVMGACNPKRQVQYETYLMTVLLSHILKYMPHLKVYSLTTDEIIFKVDGSPLKMSELREVVWNCPHEIGRLVRVGSFYLSKIKGTNGWMKEYDDEAGTVEFKCLNSDIFHQVAKYYFGRKVTEYDLVINHDGKLARFLKPLDNPWE